MLTERQFQVLRKSLVRTIHDVGDEILTMALRRVKVITGNLRNSRYINYEPNGVVLGFRAPYAARVNEGILEWTDEFVRRHPVKEHYRRVGMMVLRARPTKRERTLLETGQRIRGWSVVRAHKRGPFVRRLAPRPGSQFFTRAWEIGIEKIAPLLRQNLAWAQRR